MDKIRIKPGETSYEDLMKEFGRYCHENEKGEPCLNFDIGLDYALRVEIYGEDPRFYELYDEYTDVEKKEVVIQKGMSLHDMLDIIEKFGKENEGFYEDMHIDRNDLELSEKFLADEDWRPLENDFIPDLRGEDSYFLKIINSSLHRLTNGSMECVVDNSFEDETISIRWKDTSKIEDLTNCRYCNDERAVFICTEGMSASDIFEHIMGIGIRKELFDPKNDIVEHFSDMEKKYRLPYSHFTDSQLRDMVNRFLDSDDLKREKVPHAGYYKENVFNDSKNDLIRMMRMDPEEQARFHRILFVQEMNRCWGKVHRYRKAISFNKHNQEVLNSAYKTGKISSAEWCLLKQLKRSSYKGYGCYFDDTGASIISYDEDIDTTRPHVYEYHGPESDITTVYKDLVKINETADGRNTFAYSSDDFYFDACSECFQVTLPEGLKDFIDRYNKNRSFNKQDNAWLIIKNNNIDGKISVIATPRITRTMSGKNKDSMPRTLHDFAITDLPSSVIYNVMKNLGKNNGLQYIEGFKDYARRFGFDVKSVGRGDKTRHMLFHEDDLIGTTGGFSFNADKFFTNFEKKKMFEKLDLETAANLGYLSGTTDSGHRNERKKESPEAFKDNIPF